MRKLIVIFLLLAAGASFWGCKKVTNPEPGPPVIAYKSFGIVSETEAYFVFTFTDPDGDIGLKNGDTTGAYAAGSPYYYDFHMEILKYDSTNNVWVSGVINYSGTDYGYYNYRIPYIDNKSKDKSLSGEVNIKMAGFRPATTSAYKRFKYNFYIYDRAHNKSNVLTTPEYNYP